MGGKPGPQGVGAGKAIWYKGFAAKRRTTVIHDSFAARRRWTSVGAAALLAACATLPTQVPSPPSQAITDPVSTTLGKVAAASLSAPRSSGFQLLPVASGAYETRLALANQAERSLDVQTFVFSADDTGRYLLDALRAAAVRGVRVRLLVDDLNTAGTDAMLAGFAGEPHVEVRLFNPFIQGRSSLAARLLESLHELDRVNHRMHNKLFIADNAVAVFGGRNTGDEYFMRSKGGNFVDFDVLAAGAVVPALSRSFDDYWNSAYAYPVRAIVHGDDQLSDPEFRRRFTNVAPPPLDETVPARLQKFIGAPAQLAAGKLDLVPAEGVVQADPVDKIAGTRMADRSGTVRAFVAGVMRSARKEVFVISPYFVPGELGMEAMRTLRASGVSLILLTNSLAATDEPMVHGGYLRYRKEMLEIGVHIYELSPSLSRRANELSRFGSTSGALHAKIIVVDRARLFVGSMNLDTRSERYNTELGVLMDSPALATEFLDLIHFKGSSYRLRLVGADRHIEWVSGEGGDETVLLDEPEAGPWLQLKARVLGNFVPEGWL
jgi:putative cardiolipin synthase